MRTARLLVQISTFALVALLLSAPADAQRRGKTEEKAPMFPAATREDPAIRPNQRLQKSIQQLFELSQEEGTEAEAIEVGEGVLAHRAAGSYEKAITQRILGFVEMNRDDYPAAIERLQKALEENGLSNDDHYQTMYTIAQLQFQEEQFDASIQTLEKFSAEVVTPSRDQTALLGNAYYRAERYEDAITQLQRAIDMDTTVDPAIGQLQMASLFELGRTAEAAVVAERILAADPSNAALLRNLSSIYVNADLIPKAIEVLEGGLARGVTAEERDYVQLSQLYRYGEQDDKAINLINDGLQKGILTPSLDIYRGLGEANYFSDKIEAAAEAFGKADEFAADGEMGLNQARALAELERWTEVKAVINRAIARGVRRPGDAYVILGAAEFGLNNETAALNAYREAAKHPETKEMAESYLRQATRR